MYRHRIHAPLKEAIDQGKKHFFIYGNGVSDCFLENIYAGVYDFQKSLTNYFLDTEELKCKTFIVVADQVNVLTKQGTHIREITDSYLRPKIKNDDMGDDMEDINSHETSSEVSELGQQLEATDMALYNHITAVKRKISMQKTGDRTAVFFKDFEWMASLYISPDADSVKYIRMLKEFLQLSNCYVIVTIENIELLERYNFETKGSNIIYVGNPSAGEIKYTYLKKFLSEVPDIDDPSLDMFEELENIAYAVASSKKSLRESIQVLDKLVIESGKTCLKREDFEIAVKRITEEKVYLDDVIIDEKEKQAIINAVDAFIENDEPSEYKKGIILTGPPGTGKTEIVKALANEKNCYFMSPKLSDLKGEFIGQTGVKVKRIFDEARANAPAIMFIDEADTVFPARDASTDDTDSFNKDMVNQFLQEIEGVSSGNKKDKIFIIAATNRPAMIDAAIQSRLSERIIIGLPNASNRIRIFDSKLKKDQFTIKDKSYRSEIESKTVNMSGRDITNFVKELKTEVRHTHFKTVSALGDNEESKQLLLKVMEKNEKKLIDDLQKRVPVKVVSPNSIYTRLKDIIGYDNIKRSICRQADYICASQEERAKARKMNIKMSKGVLMYGPPGNAKTKLAEAIAKENNFYFIKVISKDFVSDSIAKQLDNLQIIFDQTILLSKMCSKHNGVLLFFDEIDSLASRHMSSVVRGTLLDYLAAGEGDDSGTGTGIRSSQSRILLMAATNHYDILDDAVIRRGRIDEHLFMDNPSEIAGTRMLGNLIENDKVIKNVPYEIIHDMYKKLENKIKEQKNDAHCRPSGSDIVNMYQDIKAEAFFMQKNVIEDDSKICIDENVLENYFGDGMKV